MIPIRKLGPIPREEKFFITKKSFRKNMIAVPNT